jgi:hypothetical protein
MNAEYTAEQDLKTYRRVDAMRKVLINEFLEELKDKMDRMRYDDGGPRNGGKEVAWESEDRGYHHGISQIQAFIEELRP